MSAMQKPLSPIYAYEVDLGKGKPLVIEANRVDQGPEGISFTIEYTDYNVVVAGFSEWKSYRLMTGKEREEPLIIEPVKRKKSPQLELAIPQR